MGRRKIAPLVAWRHALLDDELRLKVKKGEKGVTLTWRAKARKVRPLTAAELDLVIGELGTRDAALVRFAAETGLRPCELIGLERRDVDRVACVVLVEREHVEGETKPYGKTAASRTRVPLTAKALEALDSLPTRLDTRLLSRRPRRLPEPPQLARTRVGRGDRDRRARRLRVRAPE
jgi:integrase